MANYSINTRLLMCGIIILIIMNSCTPSRDIQNNNDNQNTVIAPTQPKAQYSDATFTVPVSTVNIPVRISLNAIEQAVNEQVKGLLYEDKSYDDNGGDNIKMKVWKQKDFSINATSDAFKYDVPLKLWVKVRYGALGLYGYQEVKGSIAMKFKTVYEIDPSWEMATVTTLTDYTWIEKPSTKILGQKVSITSIVDKLLKSNKRLLESSIDTEIKKTLNIKAYAADAWAMLQDPVSVNEEFKAWLVLAPQSMEMTPIQVVDGALNATIGIRSKAEVVVSEAQPKVTKNTKLPPFQRPDAVPDSFYIALSTQIPFTEAEKLAKEQIVGQTFTQGKRQITIQDLNLYGQDGQMIIGATVSGSLDGKIYMRGTPVFDAASSTVKIEEVDYDLETKNKLIQSANWLFHSTIIKRIEPNLVFPVKDNLTEAKTMIQNELTNYQPVKGITINGQLNDLTIQGIRLEPNGIRVNVLSNGKINIKIDGLYF